MWTRIIAIIGVILSLGVIAYYPLSEWMDARTRKEIIESLDLESSSQDSEKKNALLAQAHAYNQLLARKNTDIPASQILPYEQQLVLSNPEAPFAWIKIPKISLEMPIYHSTDEEVLAQGVGHLPETSLPVGGESTHAVLSAHSGMPNARAFDDIRELQPGDFFAICVLNDWYGYQVTDIETVWPYEMDSLDITEGQDKVTLVTCTPYGINDHRLLVHGTRTELPDDFYQQTVSPVQVVTNRRVWPFLAGLAAVLAAILIIFWKKRRSRKGKK